MWNQLAGYPGLGIFWCQIWPLAPPSRSNDGSLALVSCLSGGYRFASVLRCVDLVEIWFLWNLLHLVSINYLVAPLVKKCFSKSDQRWGSLNLLCLLYVYRRGFQPYVCDWEPCSSHVQVSASYSRSNAWREGQETVQESRFFKGIIKHPARDAFLCIGENPAPPAPYFVFLITL